MDEQNSISAPKKLPISGVVITLNEADNIAACLTSLSFCQELIVVDSESTDATVSLAESLGATVIHHAWEGYARQREFAINEATHEWVLMIDADERVTEKLAEEIKALAKKDFNGKESFKIPSQTVFMNKTLRFGKSATLTHLKLFKKQSIKVDFLEVHEGILPLTPPGKLKHPIRHFSYKNIADYFVKFNKYTSLWAEGKKKRGKKVSPFLIAIRLPFDFFSAYILRLGFLDGYPGFVAAVFHSLYTFVKYTKVIETPPNIK